MADPNALIGRTALAALRLRRSRGTLSTLAGAVLDDLDPHWSKSRSERSWISGITHLDLFIAREGHSVVPRQHVEGQHALGNWVSQRRREGRTQILSDESIAALNSRPGWVWRVQDSQWTAALALLDIFIAREGHSLVKRAAVEGGFNLGNWVVQQRVAFKAGRLDSDRARDLASRLGWVWDVHERSFAQSLAALDKFIAREGHSLVSQNHVEGCVTLGAWVKQQRADHKSGVLTSERERELGSRADWRWTVRRTRS